MVVQTRYHPVFLLGSHILAVCNYMFEICIVTVKIIVIIPTNVLMSQFVYLLFIHTVVICVSVLFIHTVYCRLRQHVQNNFYNNFLNNFYRILIFRIKLHVVITQRLFLFNIYDLNIISWLEIDNMCYFYGQKFS